MKRKGCFIKLRNSVSKHCIYYSDHKDLTPMNNPQCNKSERLVSFPLIQTKLAYSPYRKFNQKTQGIWPSKQQNLGRNTETEVIEVFQ
jgi:hypothetical protein